MNRAQTSALPWPRRRVLAGVAALAGGTVVGRVYAQNQAASTPPAPELVAAVEAYTGGVTPRPGKVTLDIANLVDNGNTVPVGIRVDSPMTAAEHVTAIALFNERNPQRDVARFTLGPASGDAFVATRMRLATSQKLIAVAKLSDGSWWSQTVDVVVTLAACIEGDP